MDTNIDKDDFLQNPENLIKHLGDRIEEIERTLNDDEEFCNKDIDITKQYVEKLEKKFYEKIQEFKTKLEQIRLENKEISEKNRRRYDDETQEINDLFSSGKHKEALKKFKDYEKHFEQRTILIGRIPKLHMTESDIEQYFSTDKKITQPTTIVTTPALTTITTSNHDQQDSNDNINISMKDKLRRQKIIETIAIDRDDKDTDDSNKAIDERENDSSRFGIRSKPVENQPTTNNDPIRNDTNSPLSTTVTPRLFPFSTRLGPTSNSKNLPFSGRNIAAASSSAQSNDLNSRDNHGQIRSTPTLPNNLNSRDNHGQVRSTTTPPNNLNSRDSHGQVRSTTTPPNNLNSRDNHGQVRSTPTPPNSICSLNHRPIVSLDNGRCKAMNLNPVSLYQHEPNKFLLMTCNNQYIILFKSQLNRLDIWTLGAIERRTHIEQNLEWHDGLIISMGYMENNTIYMFTECEFFIYSITSRRKLNTRMLPRGNDDESEPTNHPYDDPQRGIGTVYDKYMYHIYLNRNHHWKLSKTSLDKLSHMYDYDLTLKFPDVQRFIHLCFNDKTINFLVQMNDSSYAVVFCSLNDCIPSELMPPIILLNAQHPLTICSAFITCINKFLFFINDPSIDILHILNNERYLQSYSINAYAISYIANKNEFMIVTNNSICSINLNDENLFFSAISTTYSSDEYCFFFSLLFF